MNRYLRISLAAFLTVGSALAADAQTPAPTPKLNPAELWVDEQVKAGKIADLRKQFANEEERKLGAQFLEDLLTNSKPHRKGAHISGAIIDEEIDLTNAQILFDVRLTDCEFRSSATFVRTNFGGVVSFKKSIFKKDADFNKMTVGHTAFFNEAVFEGPVDFARGHIDGNFNANEAQFKSKDQEANFYSMKIGGIASIRKAIFEGPVDFRRADISSNFTASEAQFKNKKKKANFTNMKVGDTVFLNRAVFEGPADFGRGDVTGTFQAVEARFNYQPTSVGGVDSPDNLQPEVNSSQENDGVSFNGMKVLGNTSLSGAVFKGHVNLRYANLAGINVSNVSWPKKAGSLDMTGTTYKYIRAVTNDEPKSHDAILSLIEQSVFSAEVYRNLEAFFLRQGYRVQADKAFIAGKQRERKEFFRQKEYSRWLGSVLLDWLVGYGRRAWRIGIPCALLVGFGVVLFSPNKMELQKMDATPRIYNRFWYSLGLFLPIVNLESDKVWKPNSDQTFLRNYMRVHILLGWILIPILLAALTGLIK